MPIYLFTRPTETTPEAIRPAGACRWFEMPNGWHISAPDIAPILIRAVRAGRWNHGRIYYVIGVQSDGASWRLSHVLDLSDAIDLADRCQRFAEAGQTYQVRTTIDNCPIYVTKGGQQ